jgi:transcription antitermination factor NusG
VRFGEHYAAIEDAIIASLRETTNGEQIAVIESDIKVGDSVKIVEGSLRGLEAVVTSFLSGRERVRVLLNFLGREIQAELNRPAVLPAKRHPLAA